MRVVGLERLAVNDPDRGEQTQQLRIARPRRLLLHQLVDQLPVPEVVRVDGVERLARRLDETRLGYLRTVRPTARPR